MRVEMPIAFVKQSREDLLTNKAREVLLTNVPVLQLK
jgi:hypothetical protein